MDGMVIIGHRSYKSTFGANKIKIGPKRARLYQKGIKIEFFIIFTPLCTALRPVTEQQQAVRRNGNNIYVIIIF